MHKNTTLWFTKILLYPRQKQFLKYNNNNNKKKYEILLLRNYTDNENFKIIPIKKQKNLTLIFCSHPDNDKPKKYTNI